MTAALQLYQSLPHLPGVHRVPLVQPESVTRANRHHRLSNQLDRSILAGVGGLPTNISPEALPYPVAALVLHEKQGEALAQVVRIEQGKYRRYPVTHAPAEMHLRAVQLWGVIVDAHEVGETLRPPAGDKACLQRDQLFRLRRQRW